MKRTIRYISAALLAVGALGAHAQCRATDGRFSVKAHGEIGIGSALNMTSTRGGITDKSSMNSFGVDFGYTFWRHMDMSLSVNAGLGYDMIGATQSLGNMKYDYDAQADADMDGDTYRRYCELSGVEQKTTAEYLSIPVYVSFTYSFNEWIGAYANLGVRPGFNTGGRIKSYSGKIYSYGIYPKYDNLMMDDEWLNDFGERELTKSQVGQPEFKDFSMSILAGIGVEATICGPLCASVGVNYNAGLTNVFEHDANVGGAAPLVGYTVAQGQRAESLTTMAKKSRISHFGIDIALIFRF